MAFLSQTLSTIRSDSMTDIRISLLESRQDLTFLDGIDWAALDAVLNTPRFKSLRDVTVWIWILADIEPDFVEKRLPLLHRRHVLTSQLRLQ